VGRNETLILNNEQAVRDLEDLFKPEMRPLYQKWLDFTTADVIKQYFALMREVYQESANDCEKILASRSGAQGQGSTFHQESRPYSPGDDDPIYGRRKAITSYTVGYRPYKVTIPTESYKPETEKYVRPSTADKYGEKLANQIKEYKRDFYSSNYQLDFGAKGGAVKKVNHYDLMLAAAIAKANVGDLFKPVYIKRLEVWLTTASERKKAKLEMLFSSLRQFIDTHGITGPSMAGQSSLYKREFLPHKVLPFKAVTQHSDAHGSSAAAAAKVRPASGAAVPKVTLEREKEKGKSRRAVSAGVKASTKKKERKRENTTHRSSFPENKEVYDKPVAIKAWHRPVPPFYVGKETNFDTSYKTGFSIRDVPPPPAPIRGTMQTASVACRMIPSQKDMQYYLS
jgi:hypothetical protein